MQQQLNLEDEGHHPFIFGARWCPAALRPQPGAGDDFPIHDVTIFGASELADGDGRHLVTTLP